MFISPVNLACTRKVHSARTTRADNRLLKINNPITTKFFPVDFFEQEKTEKATTHKKTDEKVLIRNEPSSARNAIKINFDINEDRDKPQGINTRHTRKQSLDSQNPPKSSTRSKLNAIPEVEEEEKKKTDFYLNINKLLGKIKITSHMHEDAAETNLESTPSTSGSYNNPNSNNGKIAFDFECVKDKDVSLHQGKPQRPKSYSHLPKIKSIGHDMKSSVVRSELNTILKNVTESFYEDPEVRTKFDDLLKNIAEIQHVLQKKTTKQIANSKVKPFNRVQSQKQLEGNNHPSSMFNKKAYSSNQQKNEKNIKCYCTEITKEKIIRQKQLVPPVRLKSLFKK